MRWLRIYWKLKRFYHTIISMRSNYKPCEYCPHLKWCSIYKLKNIEIVGCSRFP